MKITNTHISIPPYISTAWENVAALHMEGTKLVISLKDGETVEIPALASSDVELIFSQHSRFLETSKIKEIASQEAAEHLFKHSLPVNFDTLEAMGQAMRHNPEQANFPPLPDDVIKKISALKNIISEDEIDQMEPPVENCMCIYCQITRVLRGETNRPTVPDHPELGEEEAVSEEELKFEEWTVEPTSDKMYHVTNKLDKTETYTVYLGDPIGCTCGKTNCEHIIAVLRS